MARDLSTPLAALEYAMDVIASFRYDIRNSTDAIGLDLEGRGFCGGAFYRNAELGLAAALLRFQREADAAADSVAEVAPGSRALSPADKVAHWALRGAADDPRPDKSDWIRLWALARTQLGQPTDAQEWARALAAEEGPVSEPPPQGAPLPPEGTVARAAWDSGQRLWTALRLYITRPSDLDYSWHEEWADLDSALRGQLAYAAEEAMSRHEPAPPAPANPLRPSNERAQARAQLVTALSEARHLEYLTARLDDPLLLGYAGVAFTALEHLERALEQSPNPYPLDPEISADGP